MHPKITFGLDQGSPSTACGPHPAHLAFLYSLCVHVHGPVGGQECMFWSGVHAYMWVGVQVGAHVYAHVPSALENIKNILYGPPCEKFGDP